MRVKKLQRERERERERNWTKGLNRRDLRFPFFSVVKDERMKCGRVTEKRGREWGQWSNILNPFFFWFSLSHRLLSSTWERFPLFATLLSFLFHSFGCSLAANILLIQRFMEANERILVKEKGERGSSKRIGTRRVGGEWKTKNERERTESLCVLSVLLLGLSDCLCLSLSWRGRVDVSCVSWETRCMHAAKGSRRHTTRHGSLAREARFFFRWG